MTAKQVVAASDGAVDWRREYEEVLAAVQTGGGSDSAPGQAEVEVLVMVAPVERFLDHILRAASERPEAAQPQDAAASGSATTNDMLALRKRLAAIGRTLRPLLGKQESAMAAAAKAKAQPQLAANKSARIGMLQLELVARAIAYGGVKGKSAKKVARNEIRGLLDRVALLLDAANPASIVGDDGLSPFQELLEGVLAPRLEKPLPQLVRYLLKAYEFLDEEVEQPHVGPAREVLPGLCPVPATVEGNEGSTASSPSKDATKQSILSALMEERTKKRSRDEVGDKFKEMLLPQELQRLRSNGKQHRQHREGKPRQGSASSSTSSSKRRRSSHDRSSKLLNDVAASAAAATASDYACAPLVRRAISLDVSLRPTGVRTLPTRRSLPSNSSFASPPGVSIALQARATQQLLTAKSRLGSPPLLQTQVGRTPSSLGRLSQPAVAAQSQLVRPAATSSAAAVATHRQVDASRRAVVMRTPDRPRRQPARTLAAPTSSSSTGRVLVAASPPLRRPRVGAQQQLRQQNAQPLLGGSAARRQLPRAPPPPLFK